MESASVAPDSTALPCPLPASHKVMISSDETHNIVSDHLVLVRIDVVDLADVEANGSVKGFPACYWVRANHGMHGGEVVSNIERRTTRRHDLVATSCCGLFEHGLCAGGREGLKVSPHGGGYAIVAIHVRRGTERYQRVIL